MLLTAPYILLKTTLTRDITHTEIEINQGDTFSVLLNKLGISNDIEQKLLIMWAKYNNLTVQQAWHLSYKQHGQCREHYV